MGKQKLRDEVEEILGIFQNLRKILKDFVFLKNQIQDMMKVEFEVDVSAGNENYCGKSI